MLNKTRDRLLSLVCRYKFLAFLVVAITIAFVLVVISVSVYYKSGAYQLDLSRPEYQSVRSQINKDEKNLRGFDAQGEISDKVLDEFLELYKKEAKQVLKAKAFSNDVLSDEQLGF